MSGYDSNNYIHCIEFFTRLGDQSKDMLFRTNPVGFKSIEVFLSIKISHFNIIQNPLFIKIFLK